MASPRYWPCLEFELDAVACRGLEHFFGGIVEVVVLDAVRGGGGKGEKVSAGADSRETKGGGILDAGERLVDLERLGHVLAELRTHIVLGQTANTVGIGVSAGC